MNVGELIGSRDVLFLVLDTLRYDVAVEEWRAGRTPTLARVLPPSGWEERHSPGSFTYAAHHAFFAGFLPTPARPGRHPRPFAIRFGGSETTTPETCVFDAPDLVHGFASRGYRTICIGGVGFFNPESPLGRVLPAFFDEAHWAPELGVTDPRSTEHQVRLACARLAEVRQPVFLFLNVSALHQPNRHYLAGATEDSKASHAAALRYVDGQLPPLFSALAKRGEALGLLMSDHGTCYGDDGFTGHRLAHPAVWTVPYAQVLLGQE